MSPERHPSEAFERLRARAEEALRAAGGDAAAELAGARELLHELQVHQIELEMQNEELVQVRDELETSRNRYQRLYDYAPVGYVSLDRAGLIRSVNLTLSAMLSRPREGLVGRPFSKSIASGSQRAFYALLAARQSGQAQLEMVRDDGSRFWSLMHIDPYREPVVGISEYWCSVLDTAAQHAAEQALRASHAELENRTAALAASNRELHHREAMLNRFASDLTLAEQRERSRIAQLLHDHFQQLLVGAKLNLEPLRSHTIRADQAVALKRAIDLLDQSIATSRSLSVELAPPILRDAGLAAGLRWLARWMEESHGLRVEVAGDMEVAIGPQELRVLAFQSVREALFNVVKHAQAGSAKVELTREGDKYLRVLVSDAGCGFDAGALNAREVQEDKAFGLQNLRERLEIMGGCLDVDTAPGRGTRLTMVVPQEHAASVRTRPTHAAPASTSTRSPAQARAAAGPAAAVAPEPGQGLTGRKIRILLVDDHAVVRQGLCALLESEADLEVVGQAADGREAVLDARRLDPDVILMDYSMPGMDGAKATRVIHLAQPRIRIVGLSMYEKADRAAAMLEAGAAAYVTKSGSPDLLLAAIRARGTRED